MKPVLFSNALSLYNRRALEKVVSCASSYGITHSIIDKAALDEPTHIQRMLAEAADAGSDTLFINGGDGTIDLMLTQLRDAQFATWQPDILLLRGGTTNMTHSDVGFGRNPVRALNAALRRDTAFTVSPRHLIKLSGGNLSANQYGFFFGTHAITRAIHLTRKQFHVRCRGAGFGESLVFIKALGQLLRGYAGENSLLASTPMQFTIHGATRTAPHVLFVATTLKKLLLGMRVSRHNSQLSCMALMAPVKGFLPYIPSLWRGEPTRLEGMLLRWSDESVTLAMESEVTLDGELYPCRMNAPLTLSLDSCVRFLQ